MSDVIQVEGLVKCYGEFAAVDGVTFRVGHGEVFGFLGPNGAGKTTTINILCTLLKPTRGLVLVNGFDVVKQPAQVRRSIGLVFQDPSLDVQLTALENLEFHAYLYNVPAPLARAREEQLLQMLGLWSRRHDLVRNFSGGMRRRLEVARGLLHRPLILFLDEPTVGLDPQTRRYIWDYILEQRREGLTIFLTTHYLDEAEYCDRVAIIDHGRIIALDTPSSLKASVGGDVILLRTADNRRAADELHRLPGVTIREQDDALRVSVPRADEFIPRLCRLSTPLVSVGVSRPTLDDVFIKLTGRAIREEGGGGEEMRQMARLWGGRRR